MEKRKNNKKLFAIIAGSAMAFVLTIALSVSITLAYFGDTKEVTSTATLGAAVTLDSAATTTENITVIPTQLLKVDATAKCPTSATDSVLWAVVTIGGDSTQLQEQTATVNADWSKYGTTADGGLVYYFGGSAPTQLGKSTTITDKELTYSFTVPAVLDSTKNTDNGLEGDTLTVKVQFIRVQVVYKTNGTDLADSADEYEAAVEKVGAVTITKTPVTP